MRPKEYDRDEGGSVSVATAAIIARIRSGLTVKALSELSGVEANNIYKIESGKSADPGFSRIAALADALGVTVDEYVGHAVSGETGMKDIPPRKRMGREARNARLIRGMTVRELSLLSGVSMASITSLEIYDADPKLSTVELCADALGLSLEEYTGRGGAARG